MPIMDTRPDHMASMREIARALARDLTSIAAGVKEGPLMGITSFFRIHAAWRSHGWYGDASLKRLKEICAEVFECEPEDHEAFVRGIRSVAGIVVRDREDAPAPATIDDRDAFWACVAGLGRATGIEMPERPRERTDPVVRGH